MNLYIFSNAFLGKVMIIRRNSGIWLVFEKLPLDNGAGILYNIFKRCSVFRDKSHAVKERFEWAKARTLI